MGLPEIAVKLHALRSDICWGIKISRELSQESQDDFADRLTAAHGKKWDQSKVSELENGQKKTLDIVLLMIVADLQDRDVTWYWTEAPALRRRLEMKAVVGKVNGLPQAMGQADRRLSEALGHSVLSENKDVPQYVTSPAVAA